MGRNAQRRRAAKAADRDPIMVGGRRSGKATAAQAGRLAALRELVENVEYLEDLQTLFLHMTRAHRQQLEDIIKPWIPDGIPCCKGAYDADALGREVLVEDHGIHCPVRLRALH